MTSDVEITFNAVMTWDGRITGRDGRVRFASRADRERMVTLRQAHDAVLVGAATLRADDPPMRGARACWIVTRGGDLPGRLRVLRSDGPPVVVCTAVADPLPQSVLDRAERTLPLPDDRFAPAILDALAAAGHRKILCEGGPTLFGAIAEHRPPDRIHLTVEPRLHGAGTPAGWLRGNGFPIDRSPSYTICGVEITGGTLLLTAERTGTSTGMS